MPHWVTLTAIHLDVQNTVASSLDGHCHEVMHDSYTAYLQILFQAGLPCLKTYLQQVQVRNVTNFIPGLSNVGSLEDAVKICGQGK